MGTKGRYKRRWGKREQGNNGKWWIGEFDRENRNASQVQYEIKTG